MEKKKIVIAILLIFIIFLGFICGFFIYTSKFKKAEIATSNSPDNQYLLKAFMLGEPDWPYGYAHCRFELYHNRKKIVKYNFDVANDGGPAYKENISIIWCNDRAVVTVTSEESPDTVYLIFFDGRVEYEELCQLPRPTA